MKKRLFLRTAALLCVIFLLFPMLFACGQKIDPLSSTAFRSLTITNDHKIVAEVTLSAKDVEAHAGEKAYLYELLPGETTGDLAKKDPLATAPIGSQMKFEISLTEEDSARLYSAFSVYYQNGTPIVPSPRMIDNPKVLATSSHPYLWEEDPKGIAPSDIAAADALGCPHMMLSIRLSSLLSEGDLALPFCKKEYALSSATLSVLDEQVKAAFQSGAEVSLRVIADASTSDALSRAALLDFLASRYTKEENGIVTAFYLDASALSASEISAFASVAHKALLSRISSGRIYVLSPESTLLGTKAFFNDLGTRISASATFDWGAAISLPAINTLSSDNEDALVITPDDLSTLTSELKKQTAAPSYFALCDILIDSKDQNLQAATYAYVYTKAENADMDAIFYGSQKGESYGLLSPDGTKREIAEMFRRIDSGLSPDQLHLCRTVSEELYNTVNSLDTKRRILNGSANAGAGSGKADYLFDFTTGECYGFSPVGGQPLPDGQQNPISHRSGAHNDPVLFAFLRDGMPQTGIRKLLSNGESLKDVTSISLHALCNYNDEAAKQCTVTLTLLGLDRDGELLHFTASTHASTRSWQNFNFNISSFVSLADLTKPVLLTVLTETDAEAQEDTRDFGLWIKCIRTHRPQSDYTVFWIILAIVVGVTIGFLLILFLYRNSHKKPKRRRRRLQNGEFFDLNGGDA